MDLQFETTEGISLNVNNKKWPLIHSDISAMSKGLKSCFEDKKKELTTTEISNKGVPFDKL